MNNSYFNLIARNQKLSNIKELTSKNSYYKNLYLQFLKLKHLKNSKPNFYNGLMSMIITFSLFLSIGAIATMITKNILMLIGFISTGIILAPVPISLITKNYQKRITQFIHNNPEIDYSNIEYIDINGGIENSFRKVNNSAEEIKINKEAIKKIDELQSKEHDNYIVDPELIKIYQGKLVKKL